jgi:tetratricopeptide (TPR) repeat protein
VDDPVRVRLAEHLDALTSKQLLRPDPSQLGVGPAFRFHHILVRDAAYNAILKRARASLHERFVDWAERVNRDRDRATEYDEILGYHLEQASRNLAELGPLDDHGLGLGARGAEKLAAAGRRAFARNDMAAAANLLRRGVQLLPERDPSRLRLLPDLVEALTESGELPWAELFLEEAVDGAAEIGDERLAAEAALVRLLVSRYADKLDHWTSAMLEEGERAIRIFEGLDDHAGLARAWRLMMNAHGVAHQFGAAAEAAQLAGEHARLAGDSRQETRAASGYAMAALYGPTPVAEAIARCEEVLAQSPGDKRLEGLTLCLLASLRAMEGEFDEARDLYARGRAILEEIGGTLIAASTTFNASDVETLAGDLAAAEEVLRRDYELLEQLGEKYLRPTVAAYLGQVLTKQGRYDEAERFVDIAADVAAADDVVSQALWRSVRANVLVQGARYEEAVELAREAVGLLRETDSLSAQAGALLALAEVLGHAGERSAAEQVVREALALYERKGNAIAAAVAREALTDSPAPASS